MAVDPKVQQRRRGGGGGNGATSYSSSKKRVSSGARSSPRLQLTQRRTPGSARRDASRVGNRFASTRKKSTKVRGGAFFPGAHRASSGARPATSKVGAAAAAASAGGRGRKKTAQADAVSKVMNGLKGDVAAAVERVMRKAEAECGAFGTNNQHEVFAGAVRCSTAVTTLLESCSAGVSRMEEDQQKAEMALREIETRHASLSSRCAGMLQAVERNNSSLSAVVERCRAALDNLQQAESRKLKSGLDRATGVKS